MVILFWGLKQLILMLLPPQLYNHCPQLELNNWTNDKR